MSRFGDYDGDGDDRYNGGDLWTKRAQLALEGKRGRKALADLREALMALPEKRLIEGALCTVGLGQRIAAMPEQRELLRYGELVDGKWIAFDAPRSYDPPLFEPNHERHALLELTGEQPEGVCAIGAYAWFQKVKGGMDPAAAFAALPVGNEGEQETVDIGTDAGLTWTLAWELANENDETLGRCTPEERWQRFVAFIDRQLAKPPLRRPEPRPKRVKRQAPQVVARIVKEAPSQALGL